jgi:N-acetylglucosaminyldiphosphoundecaprenol N-acetyl-beta-D-mannosaminyltransferase
MTRFLPPQFPERTIANVAISFVSAQNAATEIVAQTQHHNAVGSAVHLCNAYTLALSDVDEAYGEMLQQSAINLADGRILPVVTRFLTGRRRLDSRLQSLRGADLMRCTVVTGAPFGVRHFLLGTTDPVLAKLQEALCALEPDVKVVGTYSPPFRDLTGAEHAEQTELLATTKPDIVWVGLGTPKQDRVAEEMAKEHPAVFVAVGAAFNYLADPSTEAPRFLQRAGLEWAHRLISEPRRLWRRYLFGNVRFIIVAIRCR